MFICIYLFVSLPLFSLLDPKPHEGRPASLLLTSAWHIAGTQHNEELEFSLLLYFFCSLFESFHCGYSFLESVLVYDQFFSLNRYHIGVLTFYYRTFQICKKK